MTPKELKAIEDKARYRPRDAAGYHERSTARRVVEEAAYQDREAAEAGPTDNEVLCSMNPNSWVGMVDHLLRQQTKVFSWRAV